MLWPSMIAADGLASRPTRLAVELSGHVTVYDSLDHEISGVSQQQGSKGSQAFGLNRRVTSSNPNTDFAPVPVWPGLFIRYSYFGAAAGAAAGSVAVAGLAFFAFDVVVVFDFFFGAVVSAAGV
jgi:hypothetical protein